MASGGTDVDGVSVWWWFAGAGLSWAYSWVVPDGLEVLTVLSASLGIVLAVGGLVVTARYLIRRFRPDDSPPAAAADSPG